MKTPILLSSIIIVVFLISTPVLSSVSSTPIEATLTLAYASGQTDSSGNTVIVMNTGDTAKKVAVTATLHDPTSARVSFPEDSLPLIQGVTFHYEVAGVRQTFCEIVFPAHSCTIDLVIDTIEASPTAPDFHNNAAGALPGNYQLPIAATANNIAPAVPPQPLMLSIRSGKVSVTGKDQKKSFKDGETVVVKQGTTTLIYLIIRGFPKDDGLPASATISMQSTPSIPEEDGYVFLPSIHCSKKDLQGGCPVYVVIKVEPAARSTAYTETVYMDTSPVFSFFLRIEAKALKVTSFQPLFFDTSGAAKTRCIAVIDPTLTGGATPPVPPTFDIEYDQVTTTRKLSGIAGKPSQNAYEYVAEADMPFSLNYEKQFSAHCSAKVSSASGIIEDKETVSFPLADLLTFAKNSDGITCKAQVNDQTLQRLGLSRSNVRLVLSILDKGGNTILTPSGAALKAKSWPKVLSLSYPFTRAEVSTSADQNKPVICRLDVELYASKNVKNTPPQPPPLTLTTKAKHELDQRCDAVPAAGFGTSARPYKIRFIGVGTSKTSYDELINEAVTALQSDPLYNKYISLFSLQNVVYPYPEDPQDIVALISKAGTYTKLCPADFTVFIGVVTPPVFENKDAQTSYKKKTVVMFEPKNDFGLIFRHEAAHLFADLNDEYVNLHSALLEEPYYNCVSGKTTTGKSLCFAWQPYPSVAACLPGCQDNNHERSTENSLMRNHETSDQFSVVQCAWLVENFEKLRTPERPINFDRGMQHCIANLNSGNMYNLISQTAAAQ